MRGAAVSGHSQVLSRFNGHGLFCTKHDAPVNFYNLRFKITVELLAIHNQLTIEFRSVFPRCTPSSYFSRILSQNSAQSQLLLWDCFADSLFLTELQNGGRSLIQFYFIISQARSTAAACTDHDLLLNPPS
jgi:hypothetical protein